MSTTIALRALLVRKNSLPSTSLRLLCSTERATRHDSLAPRRDLHVALPMIGPAVTFTLRLDVRIITGH